MLTVLISDGSIRTGGQAFHDGMKWEAFTRLGTQVAVALSFWQDRPHTWRGTLTTSPCFWHLCLCLTSQLCTRQAATLPVITPR